MWSNRLISSCLQCGRHSAWCSVTSLPDPGECPQSWPADDGENQNQNLVCAYLGVTDSGSPRWDMLLPADFNSDIHFSDLLFNSFVLQAATIPSYLSYCCLCVRRWKTRSWHLLTSPVTWASVMEPRMRTAWRQTLRAAHRKTKETGWADHRNEQNRLKMVV